MKKTIALAVILLVALCGNWVSAQNQNYLPSFINGFPQEKFLKTMKDSLNITDEDIPGYKYAIWVNAWFGTLGSKNGNVFIKHLVTLEWNNGHFFNGQNWVQGNINTFSPGESTLLRALFDLQQRAEGILGKPIPPIYGELPNKYVNAVLKVLSEFEGNTSETRSKTTATFKRF